MEKTQQLLAQITSYIHQCKSAAHGILNDPSIRQWDTVLIDQHSTILTSLEISPDDLHYAATNYQKTAEKLVKEVARWENAKGNLEADIRLTGIPPQKIEGEISKLLSDCRQMQNHVEQLNKFRKILAGTAQIIQQNLSITTLTPLAKIGQPIKKKNLFNEGLAVFAMITKDPHLKSSTLNIHDLAEQGASISVKFSKLELPDMPSIAQLIIKGHVDTCKTALEEANSFLLFCERLCSHELHNIEKFMEDLDDLKKHNFAKILSSMPDMAQTLRHHISTFEHKSRTMKEIRRMTLMLSNLQNIYSAIRYSYLPSIAERVTDKNTSFHPDIFAAAISRHYFHGIRGFFRLMRSFLTTKKKRGALTEIDLTDKISIALSTCPYYHAKEKNNIAKTLQFIDNLISDYSRPFPYDDLTVILKNSIATYGSMIEKDFYKFKPDGLTIHEDEETEKKTPKDNMLPLGRLLDKIEIQAHRFKTLQPQQH